MYEVNKLFLLILYVNLKTILLVFKMYINYEN